MDYRISHRFHMTWLHWLLAALWSGVLCAQDAGERELVRAAGAADLAGVSRLLQQGVSANAAVDRRAGVAREEVATAGVRTSGDTALAAAARARSAEIVRLLLASGADVNRAAVDGTPLAIAALRSDRRVAELLLAARADPNERDGAGATPLYRAVLAGDVELARRLLAAGADPNLRSPAVGGPPQEPGSGVPLAEAAKRGDRELARALV